ncbi:membrane protein [Sinisalibacter lacisalsi]|uniref:Membrane protein n=2 Tax=Sinisalibacter lacisalsi TaxID=1526570 RepID=A0ABQ1QNR6_9RHOB|nr:membrane protein [Sinisalibacter lacisalsi]
MTMTGWILAVLALFFLQTLLPSMARAASGAPEQLRFLRGPRDERPAPTVMAGRMERALRNMFEALPIFIALALLAEVKGITGGWALTGAAVFFAARLAYVPAYGSGIVLLRSAVWAVGHAGLVMMIVGVV